MIGIEVYETSAPADFPDLFGKKTEWRFRIKGQNGEIVAASEAYTTKDSAQRGVRALRRAMLPATLQTEQYAESWQRGWLFAYYQERGHSPEAAEQKSKATPPAWLQEIIDFGNPYKRGDA